MKKLILASESPRRRQLLDEAGFKFEILVSKVSETPNKNLNVKEQILDIARRKAEAVLTLVQANSKSNLEETYILAADTEVILENSTLGKPGTPDEAASTLKKLSGIGHEVVTAVVLLKASTNESWSHIETTTIFFKKLSDEQIRNYVATGDPMDKAGSYGIQKVGDVFVERIEGSFDNVVGLPVSVVKKLLQQSGFAQ